MMNDRSLGYGMGTPPKWRIAVAGFQHETNTFGHTNATMQDFEMADSWPPLLFAQDVANGTRGLNLPIAGFVAEMSNSPEMEMVPVLWCAAEPSAHVEDEAFETICGMIIDRISEAGKIDGIYLDLHGAMVTRSFEDGEGELLERLRRTFGTDVPIVASLDLHANVTQKMVDCATVLDAYRTYPHLDMATTGARCMQHMKSLLRGRKYYRSFRQIPYLLPLHAQNTHAEPCKSLYHHLESECELADVIACIALGFTAADTPHTGPAVIAYAASRDRADAVADRLYEAFMTAEASFTTGLMSADDAVRLAMQSKADKPVVIADVQDNPGAGATSDTTGLLKALASQGAKNAVLGLLHDPVVAGRAHELGMDAEFQASLGGWSGAEGDSPYLGSFRVEALGDGCCAYTGEMYGGGIAALGKCAVLRVLGIRGDVRVVVSSNRSQCLDQAIFSHIGVDLAECNIIAVKSTVHYRADFEPLSSLVLEVEAPGLFICNLEKIPFQNLRRGMRIGPQGRPFAKQAS